MKASELRIGSYVYFEDELLKFDFEMGWNFDYIKPIPLTKEWLVKFGFKEIERYTHDFEEIIYSKSIIVGSENHCETLTISMPFKTCFIGDYLSDEEYTLNIEIKHVHQLQNLYFALTNKEL